jgi:RHH-type proline utilization regulon transcriptional repressor/proline dehydrogenase/delta 1-pyrroline-5-carboxylate dehydrogenase
VTPRIPSRQLEELTRRYGLEMFERMERARPTPLAPAWWQERGLQLMMQDERLKVQAFRFIDALPTMRDDADVARHLRDYFVLAAPKTPATGSHDGPAPREANCQLARLASQWMDFRNLDSLPARFFAWVSQRTAATMARQFIAGSNPREAERAIMKMRGRGLAFTIDVLGEAALSRREADAYVQTYLDLIEQLAAHAANWPVVPLVDMADGSPIPRVNVSVKLTAIHPGMDPIAWERSKDAGKQRLRPILRKGMQVGAHVHIDMEHYAIKDLTLALCREIFAEPEFRDYPHFGIVLQAYLKECERDAVEFIDYARKRGAPLWVRLVKGAYWDTETVLSQQWHWPCPVWEQKWQSDAAYERLTRLLLENWRHTPTALASHNVRSLCHGMALRTLWSIPSRAFELQALYGMGDPIQRAAVEMGQRCRVYTPYGQMLAGMAYFIRRLLENTANESFLRHTCDTDASWDELLENPEVTGRGTPPPRPPVLVRYERGERIMDPFENVADTDFSREENRRAMSDALRRARAGFGVEIPLVIGGQAIRTGSWLASTNPSRPSETIARVAQADAACVDRAVAAAHEAFVSWRHVDATERAEYVFSVAGLMQQRRFDLAALIGLECGKPWREADADVSEAIDFCNYYASEMLRLARRPRRRDVPGETNTYYYTPTGVTVVLSPWSFPLALLAGMTAAAIVTGNTVVMKPASAAAVTAQRLAGFFEEAGLPAGVLNYLPGPGASVGEALVRHPGVAMIAFTGSRDVGLRINRLAAEHPCSQPAIKKLIAEMGGKNAVIVDSDADLDEAIRGVAAAAFGYAGQKCTACSRVVVLAPVYERFLDRLVENVRGVSLGPADEPTTLVPPVIDAAAQRRIREYVELGKREARCVLEVSVDPQLSASGGHYVGPAIFADVPPGSRIAQEEIFGPVLCVLKANDIREAIEIFNNSAYGLTGGIYSRSPASIELARAECQCGTLYINRRITGSKVDLQPFGGYKLSGTGARVGGPDYLIQFCEARTVAENTLRRGFAPKEEQDELAEAAP